MRKKVPFVMSLAFLCLMLCGQVGKVFADGAFIEDNFNSYNGGGCDEMQPLDGQGGWNASYCSNYPCTGEGFWVTNNANCGPLSGMYWEGTKGVLQWSPIGSYYSEAMKQCTFPPDGSQKFNVAFYAVDAWVPFTIDAQFNTGGGGIVISIRIEGEDECAYYLTPSGRVKFYDTSAYDWGQWFTVEIEWRSSDSKVRYKMYPQGGTGTWTDWVPRASSQTPTYINIAAWSSETDVTVWWDDFRAGDYIPPCYTPSKPSILNPANEATNVGLTTDLSWTAGAGATSHDVYFGTESPGTFQGNQTGTTFDTGTMSNNTTYYWRIDEKNACGTTTGDVWSFTTVQAGEIIEINSDITTNQLWTMNNIYYVTASVNVQALLVIEPGTLVIFGYDCGLFVNNGGTLISKGTPDKPIIYTCDWLYFYYPEDIGYYWWYIYYYDYGEYYFCPIYIEETASPATTVTYSFIEGAVVGIATKNIAIDHPIENNYLCGNTYGIHEYGTKHTDIINNLCYFNNCGHGIDVHLADVNGTGDANSHILIQNNTCNSWQYYGITVHGVEDGNNAGSVMLVNNIVSYAWYGLNLVDGYMKFDVSNTGYSNNLYMNKNWDFNESNPVEANECPYVEKPGYFDFCYLDQNCVFINAGLGYIDQTPLIGMTTDKNGTPDSNFVDLGFHHPNWNYSNEPNIIPTISGDPNTGWVNVGITGFAPDTQQVFVLADGEYIGEICWFREEEPLLVDISSLGPGTHQLKAVSISDTGRITCSNLKDSTFNCFLNYCFCADAYDSNEPHYFCAYYPGAENVSVKVYNEDNSLVWSQTYSGQNLNGFIPAEVALSDDLDYIVFEETPTGGAVTKPLGMSFNPDKVPANIRALIIVPRRMMRWFEDYGVIQAVKGAFDAHGVPYDYLKGSKASYKVLAWYGANRNIQYIYYCDHGGYGRDPNTGEYYFGTLRSEIMLSDGRAVSAKQSDFPPGQAPPWCKKLSGNWENTVHSIYQIRFPQGQLKFVHFDCCWTGHLKLTGDDRLIEGPGGSEGIGAYYHNDMSWALNMKCGETRVYQGWWGEVPKGGGSPYNIFAFHEWTKLGEGYNLWDALTYAIWHTKDPTPRENLRFMGQGYFPGFRIE